LPEYKAIELHLNIFLIIETDVSII